MMSSGRYIIRAIVVAFSLALAACDEPPRTLSPVEKPVARSASEQKPGQNQPDAVAKEPEVRKPLDLSMPPQPKVDLGSLEGKPGSTEPLLPDLFEQGKTSDERPLSLKGRVLTDQTGQEDLDSIEGGEIIMEMKTR